MIKDSTKELMEEEAFIPQNESNQWLHFLNTGMRPKPALTGRLKSTENLVVSSKQKRGVQHGK